MTTRLRTKTEILEETAAFYGEDVTRRAVRKPGAANTSCVYKTDDDRRCAFSRCCTEEGVELLHEICNSGMGINGAISSLYKHRLILRSDDADALLKPQYQGHTLEFWNDVQDLHDVNNDWDCNGITPRGQDKLNSLLSKWGSK